MSAKRVARGSRAAAAPAMVRGQVLMKPSVALSARPRQALSRRRKMLFIGLILIVFAVLQEAAFRWAFPLPEVDGFNRVNYAPLDMFSSEFGRARKQGLMNVKIRWQSEPDGFAFDHNLNLYGFRDRNFSIAPPRDRSRALFVGDSYTEGCGAADGESLPKQFEKRFGGSQAIEALNLGVAGADFPEYIRLLRDAVDLLRPQAVFLIVFTNDLPAPPLAAPATQPAFPGISLLVPRAVQVVSRLLDGAAVPRRFPTGPFPFVEGVPAPTNPLTRGEAPAGLDPSIYAAMKRGTANPWNAGISSLYEEALRHDFSKGGGAGDYLRAMNSLCRRAGATLRVAYIPYCAVTNPLYAASQARLGGQISPDLARLGKPRWRAQQNHLRKECAALGLPFIDATDPLTLAEKTRGRMYWPVDGHCTAAGYGVVADLCAQAYGNGRQ